MGIVVESGSGKSVLASALVNLVSRPGRIVSGTVKYRGNDLLRQPAPLLQQIRGREIGLIVQNAKAALNPLITVGRQLVNMMRAHGARDERTAVEHAVLMLKKVGIPDPEVRLHSYPHQLSAAWPSELRSPWHSSNNPRY